MSAPLPRHSSTAPQIEATRHCVFRCREDWFALPATSVREITYAPKLSVVPGSHPLLAGMCHLRSEFLPVVRVDVLLADEAIETANDEKLLVLGSTTGGWAILISEVLALEPLDTLTNGDVNLDDSVSGVVLATAMFRDEVVRVLDPHRLLHLAQSQLENHWSTNSPESSTSGIR
tara:strand:+ start:19258 stop:19782 length:525 start_codon:yes stop_codon:yes gene_type:complete